MIIQNNCYRLIENSYVFFIILIIHYSSFCSLFHFDHYSILSILFLLLFYLFLLDRGDQSLSNNFDTETTTNPPRNEETSRAYRPDIDETGKRKEFEELTQDYKRGLITNCGEQRNSWVYIVSLYVLLTNICHYETYNIAQ